jgi:phage minor structural protein
MYKVYCDNDLIYDNRLSQLSLINPSLSLELNKTGSFTFTIYPSHPYFDKLKKLKSIITVYQDGFLIFRGRILNDKQGWHNEKQVTCEGELAFLLDSIQRPYDFMSGERHTTVEELFAFFIENHNSQVEESHQFKLGNITVHDPNNYIVRADSTYMNTWDSINKKLIESFGGYLWVRHEPDGNYIDYLLDFETISSQTIEFGKNLLDLSRVTKGEDIATAIIPLGAKTGTDEDAERLTIASVNNDIDYVFNQEAVDTYGWIFKTVVWDDVTEESNLLRKGNEYLASAVNLLISIDLSAVDLSAVETNISAFHLGTYISVKTKPHGLNSLFLVTKLSLNLATPKKNKLTLGTSYASFTEKSSGANKEIGVVSQQLADSKTQLSTAIQDVTEQTTSAITQTSTEILTQISEDYFLKDEAESLIQSVNTQFSQTNEEFEFRFNEFYRDIQDVQNGTDAKFQSLSKYIRFVDGNIILGEEGNQLTLRIENDKISFLENGYEIAYWQNRKFYAVDGEFINSLKLGNFSFIPRTNGNLSFKKVVG